MSEALKKEWTREKVTINFHMNSFLNVDAPYKRTVFHQKVNIYANECYLVIPTSAPRRKALHAKPSNNNNEDNTVFEF